jgi:hypothetical protein
MTWGILVQRPVVEEQVPGYADIFEALPRHPEASALGVRSGDASPTRTLRISIKETLGNQGTSDPIIWE